MSRWSDKSLAARVTAGDRAACTQLIDCHYAAIYRMLARLSRDNHLAEDLAQETFAAAWTHIGDFTGASSLATWLYRIAYRKFVDSRRRRTVAQGDDFDRIEASMADPSQRLLADEEAAQVHRALARLPAAQRDALTLHYWHGLSYREMAGVLDEPLGTIKWRTSKALDNLKALLEEDNHEPQETGNESLAPIHAGRRTAASVAVADGA